MAEPDDGSYGQFIDAEDWRQQAACRGSAPRGVDADRVWGHDFFPHHGQSNAAAKRVCSRCCVQEECLAFALASGERFGVWGGCSALQRRYIAHLMGLGFTLDAARTEAMRPRYRRSMLPDELAG